MFIKEEINSDEHQQQHLFACCFQLTKNIRQKKSMLMQPNLVLIILKYLEKRCQTYIWEMFCLYGLKIQKLQGIIEFLEKKLN